MPRKCKPGQLFCLETTSLLFLGVIVLFTLVLYTNQNSDVLNGYLGNRKLKRRVKFNLNNNQIKEIENRDDDVDAHIKLSIDTDYERPNINKHSYRQYLHDAAHSRVINPLLPPERSYEQTYGIPVNIPSRGLSGGFQQVGMLYKETVESEDTKIGNSSDTTILALYGRPTYPGSNRWSYYTASDKYNTIKMPFTHNGRKCDSEHGCDEIQDDDMITLPAYNGNFRVKVYDYDRPRYIPYVW